MIYIYPILLYWATRQWIFFGSGTGSLMLALLFLRICIRFLIIFITLFGCSRVGFSFLGILMSLMMLFTFSIYIFIIFLISFINIYLIFNIKYKFFNIIYIFSVLCYHFFTCVSRRILPIIPYIFYPRG